MTYSSIILADNPQAYYRLNETSGNIAHDSTSSHYDAKLSGTFTLGQQGAIVGFSDTSILFDGLTGILSLPYQLNYTTFSAISIEFWIRFTADWQNIVVTCDNTTTLVYRDLVLISTSNTASIEIGSLFDFVGSYSTAYLAQFALYNYVLSSAQRQIHYNNAIHYALFPSTARRTGVLNTAKRRAGKFPTTARRTGVLSATTRRTGVMPVAMRRTGIFSSTKRRTGVFASAARRTGAFPATNRRQTQ